MQCVVFYVGNIFNEVNNNNIYYLYYAFSFKKFKSTLQLI